MRAVFRTWLPRYLLPMAMSMLFLALGCLSAALFMRGLVQWFETRDEGVGRAVMLVILLTLSEMGKVRVCACVCVTVCVCMHAWLRRLLLLLLCVCLCVFVLWCSPVFLCCWCGRCTLALVMWLGPEL